MKNIQKELSKLEQKREKIIKKKNKETKEKEIKELFEEFLQIPGISKGEYIFHACSGHFGNYMYKNFKDEFLEKFSLKWIMENILPILSIKERISLLEDTINDYGIVKIAKLIPRQLFDYEDVQKTLVASDSELKKILVSSLSNTKKMIITYNSLRKKKTISRDLLLLILRQLKATRESKNSRDELILLVFRIFNETIKFFNVLKQKDFEETLIPDLIKLITSDTSIIEKIAEIVFETTNSKDTYKTFLENITKRMGTTYQNYIFSSGEISFKERIIERCGIEFARKYNVVSRRLPFVLSNTEYYQYALENSTKIEASKLMNTVDTIIEILESENFEEIKDNIKLLNAVKKM